MTLHDIIKERILVLDGAMGTMIQQYGLTETDFRGEQFKDVPGQMKGNNDILCLTRPDVIADIHRKYLDAGADLITTCNFSSQRVSMADYQVENYCREMNLAGAKIACQLADEYTKKTPMKPRFVLGDVGPTNKTLSISPDVSNPALRSLTYDELVSAYVEQMEALLEGGVDALLIETIFDSLACSADAVHYGERHGRQNALWSDLGGILGQRTACRHLLHRIELLVWCTPTEAFPEGSGRKSTLLYLSPSQCRTAQFHGTLRPDA